MVAITVAVGFVFYLLGSVLPIPGNKFIVMAPMLSFMMYMVISNTKKRGAVFAFNAVFGVIMVFFNAFMSVAIVAAAILTEVLAMIIIGSKYSKSRIALVSASYAAISFLCAFWVTYYLTGNVLFFALGGTRTLLFASVFVFAMGIAGALLCSRTIERISNLETERKQ